MNPNPAVEEKANAKASALADPAGRGAAKRRGRGDLSQWELIRIRFCKHRIALFSLFVLIVLYIVALFAEFFAPYPSAWRNLDFAHCPPQLPAFSLTEGFHTYGVERHIDPVTFRSTYRSDPDHIVPLGFFVRGEPYSLFGFLEWDRRFFGVDPVAYERRHGQHKTGGLQAAGDPEEPVERVISPQPAFYFFGADKHGYDIFSRVIYGARVSLSVGVIAIAISDADACRARDDSR